MLNYYGWLNINTESTTRKTAKWNLKKDRTMDLHHLDREMILMNNYMLSVENQIADIKGSDSQDINVYRLFYAA